MKDDGDRELRRRHLRVNLGIGTDEYGESHISLDREDVKMSPTMEIDLIKRIEWCTAKAVREVLQEINKHWWVTTGGTVVIDKAWIDDAIEHQQGPTNAK